MVCGHLNAARRLLRPGVSCLLWFQACTPLQDRGAERHEGDWQADCVLMLWLSQLLLIPFDLATVDSSMDASASIDRYSAS